MHVSSTRNTRCIAYIIFMHYHPSAFITREKKIQNITYLKKLNFFDKAFFTIGLCNGIETLFFLLQSFRILKMEFLIEFVLKIYDNFFRFLYASWNLSLVKKINQKHLPVTQKETIKIDWKYLMKWTKNE